MGVVEEWILKWSDRTYQVLVSEHSAPHSRRLTPRTLKSPFGRLAPLRGSLSGAVASTDRFFYYKRSMHTSLNADSKGYQQGRIMWYKRVYGAKGRARSCFPLRALRIDDKLFIKLLQADQADINMSWRREIKKIPSRMNEINLI